MWLRAHIWKKNSRNNPLFLWWGYSFGNIPIYCGSSRRCGHTLWKEGGDREENSHNAESDSKRKLNLWRGLTRGSGIEENVYTITPKPFLRVAGVPGGLLRQRQTRHKPRKKSPLGFNNKHSLPKHRGPDTSAHKITLWNCELHRIILYAREFRRQFRGDHF